MEIRKLWVVALSLAGTALIIWLDGVTDVHLDFTLFYLFPICAAVWSQGFGAGVLLSLVSAAGLLSHSHFSSEAIPRGVAVWNASVALGVFLSIVWLLTELKGRMAHDRAVSKFKSEMLSMVSHEFLNMLTIMKGALSVLEQEQSGAEERKTLYAMLKGVYSVMQQTSENFLSHARMESGRFELDLKKTCLNRVIEETAALLRPLAEKKGLRVVFQAPVKELCVTADRAALALVLQNLIGNAIKYSPDNASVEVSVALPDDVSSLAVVSVQDHGIGIAREEQEKVFSGFYRASNGKSMAKGFGVGLKVSREIVDAHGGRLEVESSPGAGAKFSFTLPCLGVCDHRVPLPTPGDLSYH